MEFLRAIMGKRRTKTEQNPTANIAVEIFKVALFSGAPLPLEVRLMLRLVCKELKEASTSTLTSACLCGAKPPVHRFLTHGWPSTVRHMRVPDESATLGAISALMTTHLPQLQKATLYLLNPDDGEIELPWDSATSKWPMLSSLDLAARRSALGEFLGQKWPKLEDLVINTEESVEKGEKLDWSALPNLRSLVIDGAIPPVDLATTPFQSLEHLVYFPHRYLHAVPEAFSQASWLQRLNKLFIETGRNPSPLLRALDGSTALRHLYIKTPFDGDYHDSAADATPSDESMRFPSLPELEFLGLCSDWGGGSAGATPWNHLMLRLFDTPRSNMPKVEYMRLEGMRLPEERAYVLGSVWASVCRHLSLRCLDLTDEVVRRMLDGLEAAAKERGKPLPLQSLDLHQNFIGEKTVRCLLPFCLKRCPDMEEIDLGCNILNDGSHRSVHGFDGGEGESGNIENSELVSALCDSLLPFKVKWNCCGDE